MSREKAQEILTYHFGPFGRLVFPYQKMGNIDSLDLFGTTEVMIFAMYVHNRSRWRKVLDIGANLGLHSILMAKLGMSVKAFEPDAEHFAHLLSNLRVNDVWTMVNPQPAAVHTMDGQHEFVRVLNNLTGNHLTGYKESYGPRDTVMVQTVDCRKLWEWADFAKIDSEGNEAELVRTLTPRDMKHLQLVVEVRNLANAELIYNHFKNIGVPLWSQKREWAQVQNIDDMPHKNREGSLFIGYRGPWE